jgi:hypothetical protein
LPRLAGEPGEATVDERDANAEEEDDDRPNLLLRESARFVSDMIEFDGDMKALARQFSVLSKNQAADGLN